MQNVDITALDFRTVDNTIGDIVKNINDIKLVPFVYKGSIQWDNTKKSQYIESILMRGPMLPIVIHGDTNTVIDGLNRLNAIIDFIDDKFKLVDLLLLHAFNGKSYSDFARVYHRRIEETRLTIHTIKSPGNKELAHIVAINYL